MKSWNKIFNPRRDRWAGHFDWDGFETAPRTSVGRATCDALKLNHSRRKLIRQAEAMFALFPPDF